LEQGDFHCSIKPLLSDSLLTKKYKSGFYGFPSMLKAYFDRFSAMWNLDSFDLVWIEKEAFPWTPYSLEAFVFRNIPFVLDYDDAVFHGYDMHRSRIVRKVFGSRLDRLMSKATLVTAGNSYLGKRAFHAGAPWVELIPTVIDLERYSLRQSAEVHDVPLIVWIGSPSTAHYLNLLAEPLKRLAAQFSFVLRIIGAQGINLPGVPTEFVPWTEDTEVDSISSCAVGIMPLEDSPWEKGKCGYKLIQYMACSLPVVASAVGANVEIVEDGKNGYLVRSTDEWVVALRTLLESPGLRAEMGKAGRARVEENYCLQKTGPRLVELLRVASKK
jgi:glycosyltransferase involved in cell wall biosynthesis